MCSRPSVGQDNNARSSVTEGTDYFTLKRKLRTRFTPVKVGSRARRCLVAGFANPVPEARGSIIEIARNRLNRRTMQGLSSSSDRNLVQIGFR
jgi:hypothetical protein